MPTATMPTADDVLDFWFGLAAADGEGPAAPRTFWFARDDAVDAEILRRFGAAVARAPEDALDAWAHSPRGWLALVIVLDQFSRNIHRGSAQAFAGDAKALALALEGIGRGDDQALAPLERVFAYLPLEHAEDPALQEQSVALFGALRDAVPAAQRDIFDNFLGYAERHRDVVAQFGRFPHRNQTLGRVSTPAELTYLAQPGAGF